ncbi:MAG: histidine kinase [Acidobacteriota bacterium]|nr:MAG: histidine kinase [Acidobacteriota bacterium]
MSTEPTDPAAASLTRTRALVWIVVLLFWTLIGAIAAVQEYIAIETRGSEVSMIRIVVSNLPIYFWALATPLIFSLGSAYPIHGGSRRVPFAVLHLALSLVFAAVYLALVAVVSESLRETPLNAADLWGYFKYRFGRAFHVSVLTYWAVLGFGFAMDSYSRLKERELEAARTELELETRLVQAKLDSLKMQLNPHFLFNTLNTVSAIMSDDLSGARRVIARLSEILRINLESTNRQTVPLRKEIELLELYLEIEQERFKDRLAVEIDVPAEVMKCEVPHFTLQPLVENALTHGLSGSESIGRLWIRAFENGGQLTVSVRDNGRGIDGSANFGVGLGNTKERLKKLYGESAALSIVPVEEGGTDARLTLPCVVSEDEQ